MHLRDAFARPLILALLIASAFLGVGLLKGDVLGREGRYLADGDVFGRDFVAFYTAGQAALRGQAADMYTLKTAYAAQDSVAPRPISYRPWFYPPPLFLFVRAIGLVPDYLWAVVLWGVTGLLAMAFALLRLVPDRRVLWLLLCPTAILVLRAGQISLLYAAILTFAMAALRDRRQILSGVLIGCLIIKPQLGLILPIALIAARQWRAFWAATITVLLICSLSLLADGVPAWQGFLAASGMFKVFLTDGLPGIGRPTAGLVNIYGALLHMGAQHNLAMIGQAITGGLAALWVALTCRREGVTHHSIAVVLTASLLAAPYVMTYDLVLLLPVAAFILTAPRYHPAAVICLFAVILAGIMLGLNGVLGWGGGVLWILTPAFSLKNIDFTKC